LACRGRAGDTIGMSGNDILYARGRRRPLRLDGNDTLFVTAATTMAPSSRWTSRRLFAASMAETATISSMGVPATTISAATPATPRLCGSGNDLAMAGRHDLVYGAAANSSIYGMRQRYPRGARGPGLLYAGTGTTTSAWRAGMRHLQGAPPMAATATTPPMRRQRRHAERRPGNDVLAGNGGNDYLYGGANGLTLGGERQ